MKKINQKKLLILVLTFFIGIQPTITLPHSSYFDTFSEMSNSSDEGNFVKQLVLGVITGAITAAVMGYVIHWVQTRCLRTAVNVSAVVNKDVTFAHYVNPPQAAVMLVDQLQNPEKYKRMNVKLTKGFLLCGLPGVGKTFLARVIAGEVKCPLFVYSAAMFDQPLVGQAGMVIRNIFNQVATAAKASSSKAAIIFIDEFDAIGSRSDVRGSGYARSSCEKITTLLDCMDGFNQDDSYNIVVIGATNDPKKIDPALKRPGRFNGIIEIPNPNCNARILTIQKLLDRVPHDGKVSAEIFAKATKKMSQADIKLVFENAGCIAAFCNKEKLDRESFLNALMQVSGSKSLTVLLSDDRREVIWSNQRHYKLQHLFINDIAELTEKMDSAAINRAFWMVNDCASRIGRLPNLADISNASLFIKQEIKRKNSEKCIKTCELFYGIENKDHSRLYNKKSQDIIKHFESLSLSAKALVVYNH